MYQVTDIRNVGKKVKVTFNEDFTIQLYKGEAYKNGIKEDAEISEEEFQHLLNILTKRARERALFLLKDMDKTEFQIRNKLKSGDYPEKIIDYTIEFLTQYGYIDDNRYVQMYINIKRDKKSINQIKIDLLKKGINKEIISEEIEKSEINNETIIKKNLEKYAAKYDLTDRKQENKVLRYLLSKGFAYDEITDELYKYKQAYHS